jgi:hypothetical protein
MQGDIHLCDSEMSYKKSECNSQYFDTKQTSSLLLRLFSQPLSLFFIPIRPPRLFLLITISDFSLFRVSSYLFFTLFFIPFLLKLQLFIFHFLLDIFVLLQLVRPSEVSTITNTIFFNWYSGRGWSPIGSTRHCGHEWSIVPAPSDYGDEEIGGMIGRGKRSTRRKPAWVPLCPPQTPHAARTQTRAAKVRSQRLTAWATARPIN